MKMFIMMMFFSRVQWAIFDTAFNAPRSLFTRDIGPKFNGGRITVFCDVWSFLWILSALHRYSSFETERKGQ